MDNETIGDLEEKLEKAKKFLDENQFSRLLTTVLECPQSSEQSCLAPAYCQPPSSKYST